MNAIASHRPTRGWRSGSGVGVVLLAASAWLSGSVWAANANDLAITYLITPDEQVSASRAASPGVAASQPTYISVHVAMKNNSTNTINQVRVTSSSLVTAGARATYDSVVSVGAISPTCTSSTPSASETQVSCSVGQMKGGGTSDFFVIYKSPEFPNLPPADPIKVTISVQSTFSEGGSPSSPPADFPRETVTKDLTLVTTNSDEIKKSIKTVLPGKGTFFTGAEKDAVNSDNQFSTSVEVPSTETTVAAKKTVTNNSILETFLGSTTVCATALYPSYFCYGLISEIEVLDAATDTKLYLTGDLAGPQIKILLTQDISSLSAKKPLPKIDDVKIFYTYPNPNSPAQMPEFIQIEVKKCSETTPPGGPWVNQPCIPDVGGRINNVKGNKGNYQFKILALDNGKYTQ